MKDSKMKLGVFQDIEERLLEGRVNFGSKSRAYSLYGEENEAPMGVHVDSYETLDIYQVKLGISA